MTDTNTFSLARMAPLMVGLGIAVAAVGVGQAGSSSGGPLDCEIVQTTSGGMMRLEAVARANRALAGTYQFRVTGGGVNISQGGEFEASASAPSTLGSVMLGGSSGGYDVRLEVKAGGLSATCAQHVRRSI